VRIHEQMEQHLQSELESARNNVEKLKREQKKNFSRNQSADYSNSRMEQFVKVVQENEKMKTQTNELLEQLGKMKDELATAKGNSPTSLQLNPISPVTSQQESTPPNNTTNPNPSPITTDPDQPQPQPQQQSTQ